MRTEGRDWPKAELENNDEVVTLGTFDAITSEPVSPMANNLSIKKRLVRLEKHSHSPFDFGMLIKRIERLEEIVIGRRRNKVLPASSPRLRRRQARSG